MSRRKALPFMKHQLTASGAKVLRGAMLDAVARRRLTESSRRPRLDRNEEALQERRDKAPGDAVVAPAEDVHAALAFRQHGGWVPWRLWVGPT